MYDRRLDAILAAVELGSYGKASERLHISTPALVKQVNAFEREHHLTLFERSRSGVRPTRVGMALAEDARAIVRQCDAALRHARAVMNETDGSEPVRMGVSVLRSARMILDLWQRAGSRSSGIRVELVPLPDDFATFERTARHLGEQVDVLACAFLSQWWADACGTLVIGEQRECMAVPRSNPLAGRNRLTLRDLEGQRVRVLRRGRGGIDEVRDALETHGGIDIVDIDAYELSTFNECAESGDLLVSKPIWEGVHPGLVNVPVDWDFAMPYGLLHPLDPTPVVQRFLDEVARLAALRVA